MFLYKVTLKTFRSSFNHSDVSPSVETTNCTEANIEELTINHILFNAT